MNLNIYMLVLMILFFSCCFEICGQKKISVVNNFSLNTLVYFALAFILFALTAFRFEVGIDWTSYIEMFKNIDRFYDKYEHGYMNINRFFHYINANEQGYYFMQFSLAVFFCSVIYLNILKENDFPILILLCYYTTYYFATEFDQTRQIVAMSIIICGNKFIKERKIIPWILIIILAMQFHTTAAIAFPLYFTDRIHLPWFVVCILFVLSLFVSFFGYNLIRIILGIAINFKFLPKRTADLLNMYMMANQVNAQATELSSGLGFWVQRFFYLIGIFLLKNKTKEDYAKFHVTNFLIGMVLMAFGMNFYVVTRIAKYFFISGNGISFYNIIPSSIKFFKKTDFVRISLAIFYALFIILTFFKNSFALQDTDYIYKSFLLHQF